MAVGFAGEQWDLLDKRRGMVLRLDGKRGQRDRSAVPQYRKGELMKKRIGIWIGIAVLLLIFIIPYIRVEILSINAEEKLASFDLSCFDNVYCEGTPRVYDCKIYSYQEQKKAKVLYVLEDCEYGVMVDMVWDDDKNCWEDAGGRVMWTVHGGSAQEFYWPLYYADKLYHWDFSFD